jgi:hypothetical protein
MARLKRRRKTAARAFVIFALSRIGYKRAVRNPGRTMKRILLAFTVSLAMTAAAQASASLGCTNADDTNSPKAAR